MIKICAFLLLLGAAVNGGLLGEKKCTWGPSYWCENFEQADECGATDHCRQNVWSHMEKPSVVDDSSACTFCKDIVNDVKNFIESNQTQATIMEFMNRVCDFLPDDYSTQECKKIQQHYMDQFEQSIRDKVDPESICRLCRLCGSSKKLVQSQAPKNIIQSQIIQPAQLTRVSLKSGVLQLQGQDDPLCDACNNFINLAKKEILDPKVQGAIQAKLNAMCKKLSTMKELECETAVSAALPEVFKIAAEELTSQLCVSAGLCTSSVMSAAKAAAAVRENLMAALHSEAIRNIIVKAAAAGPVNADACDTCEEVAGYLKIFLSNNATEQEVQQFLSSEVCSQLGQFADMCKTLVEQYVPQLYNDVVSKLDPATLCQELGLCKKTTAPIVVTPPTSSGHDATSSIQCIICEFVMDKLDDLIGKNSTEDQIIDAVEKVCSLLPSSVSKECNSLVQKYGQKIIDLLVHDATPAVVCGALGLCSSSTSGSGDQMGRVDGLVHLFNSAGNY